MRLYIFLVTVVLFGDMHVAHCMHKTPELPEDQVVPLIRKYSKKLEKDCGVDLRLYGVNWAGRDHVYDGKVHLIDVGFSVEKNMKIDEARQLFYSIVDGLLKVFNDDQRFQNVFFHYPIGYEDLYLRLSFDYEHNGHLKKGDIYMIAILENKIKYFIAEEDGARCGLETQKITPEVFVITGMSSKTRCITKPLPETE